MTMFLPTWSTEQKVEAVRLNPGFASAEIDKLAARCAELDAKLAQSDKWRDYYRAKWLGEFAVPQPEVPADNGLALTGEDARVFAETLIDPPEPSERLKRAASSGFPITVDLAGESAKGIRTIWAEGEQAYPPPDGVVVFPAVDHSVPFKWESAVVGSEKEHVVITADSAPADSAPAVSVPDWLDADGDDGTDLP